LDLEYGARYERERETIRRFLGENWTGPAPDDTDERNERVRRFRERATRAGYLYRSVPVRYGGSEQPADPLLAQVIREEFLRVGAPLEIQGVGTSMLVPTLLECGQDWQKERFVPGTIRGDDRWAQGYSEPGAGSDLASLRTRAELVDGEWILHGHKIWTSLAQECQYMFALVRTEPEAPRHAGISYLLLELDQPGVEIRPLKQITGEEHFNEVFFDGARTPADWIVGERGQGWRVSRTTLEHERSMIGGASEALFRSLLRLARRSRIDGRPALEHPEIRQDLAALQGRVWAQRYSSYYQMSCGLHERDPGILRLMNKLLATGIGHDVARVALDLIGDRSLLAPSGPAGRAAGDERWMNQFMGSLGTAIAGGTSNIQRNIIAERGLGLPRDRVAARDEGG